MNALAERKCALFLTTLCRGDRRRLMSQLPVETSRRIRQLLAELEAMPFPVAEVASEVLADEVRGLTAATTLDLDQLVALSRRLSPAWFARVLVAWPNVDRMFCLSMLESPAAGSVRRELAAHSALPPRLMEALQAEASALVNPVQRA